MTWIALTAAMVVSGPSIAPTVELTKIDMGRRGAAYLATAQGATYELSGPSQVVFDLYGPKEQHNKSVQVTLHRDERFVSKNRLKFRNKQGAPKGYPTFASVGVRVPEGKHTYRIVAADAVIAVVVTSKRFPRRLAAQAEVEDVQEPSLAAVPAASSSQGVVSKPMETIAAVTALGDAGTG
ncbi:MAG: hypothetical protein R3C68_08530, partial [Myxococcota bacterium]